MILTIVEEKNTFKEALYFLNGLKISNVIQNPEINDYINQMLINEKEDIKSIDIEEGARELTVIDIDFRDKLHVQIACAFWNTVCAEVRETAPELYEVAFNMYYALIMALENQEEAAEGGAL